MSIANRFCTLMEEGRDIPSCGELAILMEEGILMVAGIDVENRGKRKNMGVEGSVLVSDCSNSSSIEFIPNKSKS